jgi:peptidoglycan hydrolase-like protein with peptidoglycan-binding domain
MKGQVKKISGTIFFGLDILPLLLFLGCAAPRQPAPVVVAPKPEASEAVPAVPKIPPDLAPPAEAPPAAPREEPAPRPPQAEATERKAAPAPPNTPAEEAQDPVAAGAVLLNPSVPEEAMNIQSRLADLGFYQMAIDGIWGKESRAALQAYKEKDGLPNPDHWDKETQIALFRKGGGVAHFPVDPNDPIANGSVFLNPSDPQDVQTIQGRLAELGFYSGGIDGIWGKESRDALRAFKEKNSLPHPESWDRQTQMFLFRQVNR